MALQILHTEKSKYEKNAYKLWVFTIVGVLVGIAFGYVSVFLAEHLGLSLYNRDGLDSLTQKYLTNNTWDTIIQDDLFIATFDYNSMTPRFYDKYFINEDPGRYNFKIW